MCILYLQLRLNVVSVVFDFNASLNDVAPMSPMSLPIYVVRKEKSVLLMDVFCVSSFFSAFTIQIEFSECCV